MKYTDLSSRYSRDHCMAQLQLAMTKADSETEKLKKQLEEERMKKIQAVNKLAEIMNRKEYQHSTKSSSRATTADLKKKEKELRKLQQDLNMMQRDLSDSQQSVYEESQMRQKLQMELDSKDSEIEMLRQKLSVANINAASVNSGSMDCSV